MLGAKTATTAATSAVSKATKSSTAGAAAPQTGPTPLVFTFSDPVQACVEGISDAIKDADDTVSDFIGSYNAKKALIEDDATECQERDDAAIALWTDAQALPVGRINDITARINSLKSEVALRSSQIDPAQNALGQRQILQAPSFR
jgi:hypothetical protein